MLPKLDTSGPIHVSPIGQTRPLDDLEDPRLEGVLKLDQIAIGKALQAQIVALLSDGTSLVKIKQEGQQGAANVQMRLPEGFKVGDELSLTLLSKGSNPDFTVGLLNASDKVMLSSTAQWIDKLLQDVAKQPRTLRTTGAAPLVESATQIEPGKLALALQKNLEHSGVFYEAHLHQWLRGERRKDQVQQEPQNARPVINDPVTEQAQRLIPLQLDTLENRRFSWQGELLQGQPMDWDVCQEQADSSAGSEHPNQAVWRTMVSFELSQLGLIKANIRLQGQHAILQLKVTNDFAQGALKAQGESLVLALGASGTELDSFTVQGHEPV